MDGMEPGFKREKHCMPSMLEAATALRVFGLQHFWKGQTGTDIPFSSSVWTLAPLARSSLTACFKPLRAARWRGLIAAMGRIGTLTQSIRETSRSAIKF